MDFDLPIVSIDVMNGQELTHGRIVFASIHAVGGAMRRK
jgi:hypothetical protein